MFLSLWLRLRLDLPRIRGNWEYVFLLPHLAHPCPPLCHARTNLGRRPESVSPHAHRLQCVDSIDHPLMYLFVTPLTETSCLDITHAWSFWSGGSVLNFTLNGRWVCFKGRRDLFKATHSCFLAFRFSPARIWTVSHFLFPPLLNKPQPQSSKNIKTEQDGKNNPYCV